MTTITVPASKQYDVIIGSGLLSSVGSQVAGITKGTKICVVSDSNVMPLYGAAVLRSLECSGFECCSFVIPAGEASKNGETYLALLNHLARHHFTRSDTLMALGGGVVGDLTGFAAATYLRGIAYVQVPTTLLAAVDSSVGGKTAIDLPAGKNLAGAFCQPSLVLCDTDTLNTLPEEIFRDGCAEVIKYGILYDESLFRHLEHHGLDFDREAVISRCVALKRDVVTEDEFDRGARMKLNLGHTIGHSVESCSNYTISHGSAVAIGTAIVAKACGCADSDRIISCLTKFGLPVGTEFHASALASAARSDKKRAGGTIHLILPRTIGHCDICPTPVEELESFIQAGL